MLVKTLGKFAILVVVAAGFGLVGCSGDTDRIIGPSAGVASTAVGGLAAGIGDSDVNSLELPYYDYNWQPEDEAVEEYEGRTNPQDDNASGKPRDRGNN